MRKAVNYGIGGKSLLLAFIIAMALLAGCRKESPIELAPEAAIYTLTLNANGGAFAQGTYDTRRVVSGEKAQKPADPTRPGYTFAGWAATPNGGHRFDFAGEPITEARTLYAQWTLKTYAVRFDANGGTLSAGDNDAQQVSHGRQATPPADPIRAAENGRAFQFAYWSEDREKAFDFAATPITTTTTLYAMWNVDIPDTNFKNALKAFVPSAFDGDRLVISHSEVVNREALDLHGRATITSLAGIEFFTGLTNLNCENNRLTALDVSQNTALTSLECGRNRLMSLDVSQNTALARLDCNNNQLATLDVSKNTALTFLDCSNNQLTTLDARQNTALASLECSRNRLMSLDMRGMRSGSVVLNGNPLTLIKVHTKMKDQEVLYYLKAAGKISIEVYETAPGATDYTKTCSSYLPAGGRYGTVGRCLRIK